VLEWWLKILPLESGTDDEIKISYQNKSRTFKNSNSGADTTPDNVMLVRERNSRIYFLNQLFPYPVKLSGATFRKLGCTTYFQDSFKLSRFKISPLKPENTLKDFLINRFGKELYKTFFEAYTQKVWGIEAEKIPSEWGKQRIKGVSISAIITNALKKKKKNDIRQKGTETSFIEKFLYPKIWPGSTVGKSIR
jgi:protoporphyrinogen oxidase